MSWDISADGKTYTFNLRKGVRFHDGTPFNASAAKFSLERARSIKGGEYAVKVQQALDSIDVVDDYTIRLRLKAPAAYMSALLMQTAAAMISPSAIQKWGDAAFKDHPTGTGPFKYVSYTVGERIVYEKNKEYWGDPARVERLVFRIIPDTETRRLEIEKGNVDIIAPYMLEPSIALALKAKSEIAVEVGPGSNVRALYMNMDKKPFDSILVRKAIAHAIDRKSLVEKILMGFAVVANSPVCPNTPYHESNVAVYDYDPVRSKQLLAQAGYPNGFKTTMSTSTAKVFKDAALVIQANLKEIGIDVEIRTMELGALAGSLNAGEQEMLLMGRPWYADPYYQLDTYTLPGIPFPNWSHFRDEEVNNMIMTAAITPDSSTRARLYSDAQKQITEKVPSLQLWYTANIKVCRANVRNFYLSPENIGYYHATYKT